ncbi:MAG: OmpA family protein, partial [Fibrobacterota bacterium]|nr:OmpA family protein [Fibrobacterota bacterium]
MERLEITAHKGPVDEEVPVVVLRRQGPPFLEMKDLLFDTNSAVPLLSAGESLREFHLIDILAAALAYGHKNPDRVCMIYGHADTVGEEPDNHELSRKRAVAVKALLLGEETSFLSIATGTPFITVQKILASLDAGMGMHCHPGTIDGMEGPKSAKAIKRFRQGYNELFDAQVSDLDHFERSSWQAYFRIVQDQIKEALAQQGLERREVKFRLVSQRGGIVPCGERRPIEAKYRNNFRSQKNRRVELVFYLEKDIPEEETKNHFRP